MLVGMTKKQKIKRYTFFGNKIKTKKYSKKHIEENKDVIKDTGIDFFSVIMYSIIGIGIVLAMAALPSLLYSSSDNSINNDTYKITIMYDDVSYFIKNETGEYILNHMLGTETVNGVLTPTSNMERWNWYLKNNDMAMIPHANIHFEKVNR